MNIKFRTNTAISTNGLLSLNIRSESPFFLPPVKKGRLGGSGNPVFFFLRSKRAAPGGSGKPVFVFLRSKRAASGGSGNPVFFFLRSKRAAPTPATQFFFFLRSKRAAPVLHRRMQRLPMLLIVKPFYANDFILLMLQNTDVSLLTTISFPAFATHDDAIYERTKRRMIRSDTLGTLLKSCKFEFNLSLLLMTDKYVYLLRQIRKTRLFKPKKCRKSRVIGKFSQIMPLHAVKSFYFRPSYPRPLPHIDNHPADFFFRELEGTYGFRRFIGDGFGSEVNCSLRLNFNFIFVKQIY